MNRRPSSLKLRLKADERGNVAMISALAILPILSIVGLAIDLQMTTTRKNEVQAIIDAAVLSGSKLMQTGASAAEVRDHVEQYVATFIGTRNGGLSCAAANVQTADGAQDVNATVLCTQPTTLSNVFGKTKMDFHVASGTTYGIGKVEVAFVFDLSGSMNSNNRMTNLKAAAGEAVDTLLATLTENSEEDDVRIAMVSYDGRLNAGEFFDDVVGSPAPLTITATNSTQTSTSVCTKYNKKGKCKKWSTGTTTTTYAPVSITVQPCVHERIGVEAFSDEDPGPGAYIERAPAPTWDDDEDEWVVYDSYAEDWKTTLDCNDSPPLPLTNDPDDLHDYIDAMETAGGTAGHLGTAWGWYLLSPKWNDIWPTASEPLAYDEPDAKKAMILMTDGAFNAHYDTANGDSAQQARELCDAAKDEGVVIYTVAFQAPQAGKDLLSYCASDSSKAFAPDGAADLTEAYQTIASEISDLRIMY